MKIYVAAIRVFFRSEVKTNITSIRQADELRPDASPVPRLTPSFRIDLAFGFLFPRFRFNSSNLLQYCRYV
jgi:hypothetical protein